MPAIILAFGVWTAWYWPQMKEYLQTQLTVWQVELQPQFWQAVRSFSSGTPQYSSSQFLLVLFLAVAAALVAHPLLVDD